MNNSLFLNFKSKELVIELTYLLSYSISRRCFGD